MIDAREWADAAGLRREDELRVEVARSTLGLRRGRAVRVLRTLSVAARGQHAAAAASRDATADRGWRRSELMTQPGLLHEDLMRAEVADRLDRASPRLHADAKRVRPRLRRLRRSRADRRRGHRARLEAITRRLQRRLPDQPREEALNVSADQEEATT